MTTVGKENGRRGLSLVRRVQHDWNRQLSLDDVNRAAAKLGFGEDFVRPSTGEDMPGFSLDGITNGKVVREGEIFGIPYKISKVSPEEGSRSAQKDLGTSKGSQPTDNSRK